MEELEHVKTALITAAEGVQPFTPLFEALSAVNSEINKQMEILKKIEDEKHLHKIS